MAGKQKIFEKSKKLEKKYTYIYTITTIQQTHKTFVPVFLVGCFYICLCECVCVGGLCVCFDYLDKEGKHIGNILLKHTHTRTLPFVFWFYV